MNSKTQDKLAIVLPQEIIDEFPRCMGVGHYRAEYLGYLVTIRARGREVSMVLKKLEELNEPKVILAIKNGLYARQTSGSITL